MKRRRPAFFWLFPLALMLGSPISAQDQTDPSAEVASDKVSNEIDELAAANRRVQELEQREAVREAKAELADGAYSRLEILVGIYGLLITVVVLFLALRTKDAAIAEARNVAREAIDATRKELTDLQNTVVAAQVQAQGKIDEVGRLAERVKEMERETQASLGRTRVHEESAARHANELFEQSRATGSKPEERSKSPEVAEALKAAEVESRRTAQDEWSPEQYQSAINKALWLDEDLSRAESLANAMMVRFADDPAATAFAHEALGDAALERKEWTTALAGFEEAYRLLDSIGEAETSNALRIRHQQGYILNELGRSSDAEALLRELVPLCERVDGAETSGTLVTRYVLARAVLDQGKAGEAETMFRELVPLCERVDGAETSSTLDTRHDLARALLDQGRAGEAETMLCKLVPLRERVDGEEASGTLVTRLMLASAVLAKGRAGEAEAMLRELVPLSERVYSAEASLTSVARCMLADAAIDNENIAFAAELLTDMPDPSTRPDWPPRHAARLAIVRGKLCDAQGQRKMATRHLYEAREIYAQFPPEYAPRAKFEAYLAARGGLD